MALSPTDENTLRMFRNLADEVRKAQVAIKEASGEMRIVGGYLESKDAVATYKILCLPVRRAYLARDRVCLTRVHEILATIQDPAIAARVAQVSGNNDKVREDVNSTTILNDRPLSHSEVFDAWLEAVIFGNFGGKDAIYNELLNECGRAIEGIAVRITESIADGILETDALVAEVLGEPKGEASND